MVSIVPNQNNHCFQLIVRKCRCFSFITNYGNQTQTISSYGRTLQLCFAGHSSPCSRVIHRHELRRNFVRLKLPSINQDIRVTIMIELYCDEPFRFLPSNADYEDLRETFIANCILNGFLTCTAIMLNIVTICAIRKTLTLPKTLKTLLTSLAISDLSIGLLGHPTYISFLGSWFERSDPSCNAYRWLSMSGYLFSLASFLGVLAVSLDRFLALHLHLRYQELVTHKRVVTVVILIWVLSAFVSLMILWASLNTISLIILVTGICGFIVTIVVYIRIYLIVRRHKNQIQSLQGFEISQSFERTKFTCILKSTVGVFYVYLVFLASYLPYTVCLILMGINGSNIALKKAALFSMTLIFLNSSLNPVIYCWKMRHIRHAIVDMLRNMSWARIRASH